MQGKKVWCEIQKNQEKHIERLRNDTESCLSYRKRKKGERRKKRRKEKRNKQSKASIFREVEQQVETEAAFWD